MPSWRSSKSSCLTWEISTKVPDYDTKVPEKVKKTNSDKLAAYQSEIQNLLKAREMYASL